MQKTVKKKKKKAEKQLVRQLSEGVSNQPGKLTGGRNAWVAFIKLYTGQEKKKKKKLWKGMSKYSRIRDRIENIVEGIKV